MAEALFAYRVQRNLPEALVHVERAIMALPNLVDAHSIRALVARRLGLWESAELAARRAVELDPASVQAHRTLLEVLDNTQAFAAEALAAEAAAARFPDVLDFPAARAIALANIDGDVSELAAVLPTVPARGRIIFGAMFKGVFDGPQDALAWLQRDPDQGDEFGEIAIALVSAHFLSQLGEVEAARQRWEMVFNHPQLVDQEGAWARSRRVMLAANLGYEAEVSRLRSELEIYARETDDVFTRNVVNHALAETRAIQGDPEGAWTELEPLIGQPGGPTPWGLVLNLGAISLYSDVPGYRAYVAHMESQRDHSQ